MKRLLLSIIISALSLFSFAQDTALSIKIQGANFYVGDKITKKDELKSGTIYLINGTPLTALFNVGGEKFSFIVDSALGYSQSGQVGGYLYRGRIIRSKNKVVQIVKANLGRTYVKGDAYSVIIIADGQAIEYLIKQKENEL